MTSPLPDANSYVLMTVGVQITPVGKTAFVTNFIGSLTGTTPSVNDFVHMSIGSTMRSITRAQFTTWLAGGVGTFPDKNDSILMVVGNNVVPVSLTDYNTWAGGGTVAVNFGPKNRIGMGGYPTSEAPGSALTGTNHGDFAIDDIGTLVPASGGAGVYGAAWAQTGGATSYSLTGASGTVYNITIQPGKIYIATRNGAPTHPDNGAINDTQLWRTVQLSTASGGPALGDDIVWRDGSIYNPTNALWWVEPLSVASYTGSGRITIRSETADATLDVNGNPRLQHSAKMGMVYFAPSDASPYPFDFRDIWFYTNEPSPATGTFFRYENGSSGVSFYNSRIECGPAVTTVSVFVGLTPKGTATVDGDHLKNLGTCGVLVDDSVGGAVTISNAIFEAMAGADAINAAPGTSVTGCFGFAWTGASLDHQDFVQFSGGSANVSLGAITKNIVGNDLSGRLQSGLFLSGMSAPGFLTVGPIENQIIWMGTTNHGITLDRPDNPSIRFSTVLTDPFVLPTPTANTAIEFTGTGRNGATINNNFTNIIATGTQPGIITQNNNVSGGVFDVTAHSLAAIFAAYQVALPNLVGNQTDAKWKSRAGWLYMFTPANLAVASGGLKNVDNTFAGALFPAPAGYANGPWNDGTAYDPLNPTWLAAHPAAT